MPNLLDTRRFTVTVGTDDPVTVTPVNAGLRYRWEVEQGTRFYRKKLVTKLLFRGDDYTFFKALYDGAACDLTTVLIEVLCGGVWREEFTGKIVVGQGDYHMDRCEVVFDVQPYDVYDCFKRALKKQINWLSLTAGETLKTVYGTIETVECTYSGAEFGDPANEVMFLKDCWGTGTTESTDPDPSTAWRPIDHDKVYDPDNAPQLQITTLWAREITTSVSTPPGNGWVSLGGTDWARPLSYRRAYDYGTFSYLSGNRSLFYATWTDADVSNARTLGPLLEAVLASLGCDSVTEVQSDFFGINAPSTAPDNDAYTFASDYCQDVLLFQKSDVVNADASNDATILQLSLEDFFSDLANVFDVFWSLEPIGGGDYALRIEHETYYDAENGLDLTVLDGGIYVEGNNQFKANTEIPSAEAFATQEAYNTEFLRSQITYPAACSDGENEVDRTAKNMCLDFGGLLNNDGAGLLGFVLVSAVDLGGGEHLIDNTGGMLNGAFDWESLHDNLWPFGRYNIEGQSTASAGFSVQTVMRAKEQVRIAWKYCCEETDFDPVQLIKSGLGWGQIRDAEHDTQQNKMTVTLLH